MLKKLFLMFFLSVFLITTGSASEKQIESNGVKKIVIVAATGDPIFDEMLVKIRETFKHHGYSDNELTVIKTSMAEGNKFSEYVSKIKTINPDVVIVNSVFVEITDALYGSAFPVVCLNISKKYGSYVDEKGMPKANIVVELPLQKDFSKNSVELLDTFNKKNKIKSVAFVSAVPFPTKEQMLNNLQTINVKLKEYMLIKNKEEFEQVINRFESDKEIDAYIIGPPPKIDKDGKVFITTEEYGKSYVKIINKPTLTMFANMVGAGVFAGLANEVPVTQGSQLAEIAVRILKGEKVKEIKAEDPSKVFILINKMTADKIGKEILAHLMGAIWRIYTDYQGHYVGQK